jgi:hypothetical protein
MIHTCNYIWLGWLVNLLFRPEIIPRRMFFFIALFYPVCMDEILPLHTGRWKLLLTPKSLRPRILTLVARVAEQTPLLVLDGGNQFNAFRVARVVRGRIEILKQIRISREFTCYQMLSLLEMTSISGETILLLDFLATFYDESVSFPNRSRLLKLCLPHVQHLSLVNCLLVTVHPPAVASPESDSLIAQLARKADGVWTPETPAPLVSQPTLF